MAKQRFDCPGCGKTIAVSSTAKKARCPSCKEVVDVASVLGANTAAPAPEAETGKEAVKKEEAPPQAGGQEAAPAPEKAPEPEAPAPPKEAEESGEAREAERAPEPRPRPEPDGTPPAPRIKLPAGLKLWMLTVCGTLVVTGILSLFFFHPLAAFIMASALGVYIDSTLAGVTRFIPTKPGYAHAPMLWGLIGLIPFFGAGAYALVRRKLITNSAEDIAPPDMSREDMEDEGLIRAPGLLSPGMILVIGAVIVVAIPPFSKRQASITLEKCTVTKTGTKVPTDAIYFDKGKIGFSLWARAPLQDKFGRLAYSLVKIEGEQEIETGIAGDVNTTKGRTETEWEIEVKESGSFRMDVKKQNGKTVTSVNFRIMKEAE
ncbi:MAG: hypothetical protein ACYS9X_30830 [Planctomycetota bacterium]|jgi:phage FluMu protein Com